MNNVQVALTLLRQVNNSVLTYTLRTACPVMTKKIVKIIGKEIRNALAIILKNSIHKAWNRIHMSICPGLGFVDLRLISEPAYLANLLQATVNLNGLEEKGFSIPQISGNPKPGDYEELLANALKNEEMLRKDPLIKL